ncbi:MAG: chemotaxis protein CheW [Pseudobdellovibrio sp.]
MSNDVDLKTGVNKQIVQYCTFKVGKNFFGVPVLEVQEVIRKQLLTPVPLSQKQIRGLINLRGQIVTLIGLRQLFGMPEIEDIDSTNVVVKSNDSLSALIVDEINDVMDIEITSFEKAPATLSKYMKPFVKGIHKLEGQLLIILDLQKVLEFN